MREIVLRIVEAAVLTAAAELLLPRSKSSSAAERAVGMIRLVIILEPICLFLGG